MVRLAEWLPVEYMLQMNLILFQYKHNLYAISSIAIAGEMFARVSRIYLPH